MFHKLISTSQMAFFVNGWLGIGFPGDEGDIVNFDFSFMGLSTIHIYIE